MDERLGDVERERIESYARLSEQIAALGSSANMLSRALRTPAVRGRWGEMQLRRVVEIAGMLQRCDFDEQPGLFTENGRLRPDLIVHLPGGKQIVVDAKAPLEAFLDAQDRRPTRQRARAAAGARAPGARSHGQARQQGATGSSSANSPEMVVMFLPGETLFSAALQHDLTSDRARPAAAGAAGQPDHADRAADDGRALMAAGGAGRELPRGRRLGKEFYERLATFADHFDDLRRKLDGAVQAYNEAAGSFESRVLVSARRLRDLEVTTAAELPPAEPIDTVPRVLKQVGLMGLPGRGHADRGDEAEIVGR